MKFENLYLYLTFSFISIFFVFIFNHFETVISNIAVNVSCSVLAASIMAIFIDGLNSKRELEEKNKFKKLYFKDLNNHLSLIMGNLLWFEKYKNEDFINWNLPLESFLDFRFKIHTIQYYEVEEMSFKEAKAELIGMSKRYTLEEFSNFDEKEKSKSIKMFNILYFKCNSLLNKLNKLDENKVVLGSEDYINLEELESLKFKINVCCYIMSRPGANYSLAIRFLIESAEFIKQLGKYSNNIERKL